jgi:hypothetical protein
MTSMQIALIFGPGLLIAIFTAYLTRNDPITTKSIEQAQQSPLNRLTSLLSCIFGPLVVLVLINNLFGAFLLVISGISFFFQEKIFPDVFWIRGKAAKLIGVVYIALGLSLVFHHVSIF